jgi:hypothetical protein
MKRSSVKSALLATALALSACATGGPVTRGEIGLEIPFEDCPEGVMIDVVTHEIRRVDCAQWKIDRPFMLMIPAKYWTDIKLSWLKACRFAGPDCNVQVDSVDKVIRGLDELARKALPVLK